VKLFYTDHYEIPLPKGHKFPIRKYRLLREALTATGRFDFVPAPLANTATIERVHSREYVRGFINGTLPPTVMRRIGLPWSDGARVENSCLRGIDVSRRGRSAR
jgi:acetoin utilization deacetylase AcuC-like enzyme